MLIGLGWKIAAGAGLLTVVMGIIGYFGYNYMSAQNELLRQNLSQIESVNKQLRANEQLMETNFQSINRRQQQLGNRFNEIQKETSQLQILFSRHDFRRLVEGKPGLIEKRVNDGTDEVLQDLQNITDPDSYKKKNQGQEGENNEENN